MSEKQPRVLIVDDEPAIRRYLRTTLAAHGYAVFDAASGRAALTEVVTQRPDLVILDLGLPDMDGVVVTRELRQWSKVPIIVLSVRNAEQDKVAALDAGADDYLTKPFGNGELLARLRAALRRIQPAADSPVFSLGELTIDFTRRVVTVNGTHVSLTPTEYDLLRVLISEAGKVLTHTQLMRAIWGDSNQYDSHLLRVNISNLRRKLEPDPARPRFILTEPGVGYRLKTNG